MPRQKAKVRALFKAVTDGPSSKTAKVRCTFCKWTGADNGTRMAEHIENCSHCPADVRQRYLPAIASNGLGYQNESGNVERKAAASTASVASTSTLSSPTSTVNSEKSEDVSAGLSSASPDCKMKQPFTSAVKGKLSASFSGSGTMSWFVDKITSADQEDIDELLARAIFASGTPLTITENKYWKSLFAKMRPAYVPPSRYVLTGRLLDAEHARLHAAVSEKVASADTLALMCDGWSNCRNESIVNFVVTTPEPVFYKSIATEKNRHTGKYMAEVMTSVLVEIGPDRFLGVVTDNASNMKKAWEELTVCYPHLSCYGCIAHGLQLLLTDIGKLDTVKDIVAKVKVVMKEVRNSHILTATFKEHAKCALRMPVVTRWGSVVTSLECMLKNKGPLRRLAVDENAESDVSTDCKSAILNDVFWDRQQALHDLLHPIAAWITKLEADTPQLGVVVTVFAELTKHFDAAVPKSPLLKKEGQAARAALKARRDFCLTNIHKAAHLLDPRFSGKHLSEEDIVDASEFIFNTAKQMHVDASQAMTDLAEFRAKHGLWAKEFVWASADHVLPHVWWTGVCSTRQALSVIASRILNMPASSAACERSFSSYGNIHTAKRNRLTNATAGKLVYVYHNLRQITDSIGTAADGKQPTPVHTVSTSSSAPAAAAGGDNITDVGHGSGTNTDIEEKKESESDHDNTELDEDSEAEEYSLEEDEIGQ